MTDQGSAGDAIETYSLEDRHFPPPEAFKEASLVAGTFLYDEAAQDVEGFWARQAADLVDWRQEWHTICEWELPFASGSSGVAQRQRELPGPPRGRRQRRQGGVPLGGRARRHPDDHLRRPPG
jgi:hypothetical protein